MSDLTQFSGSPSKKHCSNGDSQLSSLPECIISQILSCLPTHEAVRTSVLSKDWEHKWTSIYNIDIDDKKEYYYRKDKRATFVNYMERILGLPLSVKSFSLSCKGKYGKTRLTKWMSALLKRDVESFEVNCSHASIVLPNSLFSCLSLRNLKLDLPCTFRVPSEMCFPNLTNLYLSQVEFLMEHSDSNDTLKLTFPVLDTFELKYYKLSDEKYFEICAPALTKFICTAYMPSFFVKEKIPETDEAKYYSIKVCGASLKQCKLLNYYGVEDLHLLEKNGLRVRMQLKEFEGLEELELSGSVAKVIALSEHRVPLPMFYKLKRLVLSSMSDLNALFELLHAAPSLKFLVVEFRLWYDHDYDYDALESVPPCVISDLEKIEITDFFGTKTELELAKFFLKNTTILKKLHLGSSRCFPSPTKIKAIVKKLSKMPKCSASSTIVVGRG